MFSLSLIFALKVAGGGSLALKLDDSTLVVLNMNEPSNREEVSDCEEGRLEAAQPTERVTTDPAGETFPSSTVVPAVNHTHDVMDNAIIPGQSPVVTGQHSIPLGHNPDQPPVGKCLHNVDLFRSSQQPSVDSIVHELNSAQHVVDSSHLAACVDLPGENSIQPAVSFVQPLLDIALPYVNTLPPAMGPEPPLDPAAHASLPEPTASSLQHPVDAVLPDANSISPEMGITQPIEISIDDINSLQSFGIVQPPMDVSSEVHPVEHVMDGTELVENSVTTVPRVLRTKRSFTTEFKLECVEHAERTKNKTQTARIFNVNRRRVQEWCTQKERLMSVPKQQKRLSGAGKRQALMDAATKAGETEGQVNVNHEQKSLSSKIELDNEAIKNLSSPVPANMIDPTLFDCIARNLSNIDHSMLPASMVKMLQKWSELTSRDVKTAVEEAVAQSAMSMEDVLQKRTDSSPSNEFLVMEMVEDGNLIKQPMEVEMEGDNAAQQSTSTVEEVVAAEYILGTNNGYNSVNIEGPVVNTGMTDVVSQVLHADPKEGETVREIQDLVAQHATSAVEQCVAVADYILSTNNGQESVKEDANEHVVNPNMTDGQALHTDPKVNNLEMSNDISTLIPEGASSVPVAILDALMQVASVQVAASTEQFMPMETSSTSASDQQLALNRTTEDSAKVEAALSSTTIRTRVKKSYTVEFKLDCIAYAESTSKCAAARQFNVDRRRVQDWCSKKEKLQKLVGSQHMLRGTKEQRDSDIEKQLAAWVKQQQEAGEHLTRKMVGDEATRMYQEKGDMEFVSSIGWVAKFMVRNNISLVARTRLPIYLPPEGAAVDATTSSS